MTTPALIRCAGARSGSDIDILVNRDGGLFSLGELLATATKDILHGDTFFIHLLDEQHPGHNIRLGNEHNLCSLVFGLVWEQFDQPTSLQVRGKDYPARRHSHNQFEIIPANPKNLIHAAWVYLVEFRNYPKEFMDFQNPKRVWIKVANDRLDTEFEGWPEDVLAIIALKNAKRELENRIEEASNQ